jgi:hypothetical protein
MDLLVGVTAFFCELIAWATYSAIKWERCDQFPSLAASMSVGFTIFRL